MKRFSLRDLLTISVVAALSMIVKPYLRMPFQFVQTSLGIPVGTFLGGLYMFWPVLMGAVIPKPGAVFLTCLLQGIVALVSGFTGLLGPAAFLSYLTPGAVIELLYMALKGTRLRTPSLVSLCAAGALGNAAGALTNAILFFAIRGQVVPAVLLASALTGAGGGILAWLVELRLVPYLRHRESNA